MRRWLISAAWLMTAAAAGCSGDDVETAAAVPARVVDSTIPIEESLRRFRRGLTEPAALGGGADSREALVRSLVAALEGRDTSALRRMALSADEFAWLYYPTSRFSRPPYELAPDLLWFQIQGQSERGASRLLARRAGAPLGYLGHTCDSVRTEGPNRLHGHCAIRHLAGAGDTVTERLFGLVVEHDGRFKYVTYANDLD